MLFDFFWKRLNCVYLRVRANVKIKNAENNYYILLIYTEINMYICSKIKK